jgi:hypothetical protein
MEEELHSAPSSKNDQNSFFLKSLLESDESKIYSPSPVQVNSPSGIEDVVPYETIPNMKEPISEKIIKDDESEYSSISSKTAPPSVTSIPSQKFAPDLLRTRKPKKTGIPSDRKLQMLLEEDAIQEAREKETALKQKEEDKKKRIEDSVMKMKMKRLQYYEERKILREKVDQTPKLTKTPVFKIIQQRFEVSACFYVTVALCVPGERKGVAPESEGIKPQTQISIF